MVKKATKKVEIKVSPKVTISQSKSKRSRRKRRAAAGGNHISADPTSYAKVLVDPFGSVPVHIPDDNTRLSGITTTRIRAIFNPTASSSTSTNHNFLVTFCPSIYSGYVAIGEAVAGSGSFNTTSTLLPTVYPNAAASVGAVVGTDWQSSKSRVIAAGIKVTYLGTELQRAGKIHFLQHSLGNAYSSSNVQNPAYSGPFVSSTSATVSSIIQSATVASSGRVKDNTVTGHYVPTSSTYITPSQDNTSTGVPISLDFLTDINTVNTFSILVVEDSTAAATSSPNSYEVEFIMHSENIPCSPFKVTYPLEPSFFDPEALAYGKNIASSLSNSTYSSYSTTSLPASVSPSYSDTIHSIGSSIVNAAGGISGGFANAMGFVNPYQMIGAAGAAYYRAQMQPSRRALRY